MKKKSKRTIYIATVVKMSGKDLLVSHRNWGDWAAFIDENREKAIEAARTAMVEWEKTRNGPYTILVGTLSDRIVFPAVYTSETL